MRKVAIVVVTSGDHRGLLESHVASDVEDRAWREKHLTDAADRRLGPTIGFPQEERRPGLPQEEPLPGSRGGYGPHRFAAPTVSQGDPLRTDCVARNDVGVPRAGHDWSGKELSAPSSQAER